MIGILYIKILNEGGIFIIICQICDKELKNNIALGLHVKSHNMTSKQYYDLYMKKPNEGICPVCRKETKWQSFDRGYLKHCSYKCTQNDIKVVEKRECRFIEKYGVDSYSKTKQFKTILSEKLDFYEIAKKVIKHTLSVLNK